MSSPTEQIVQLEAAIVAQESLRATLGDAAVNATIAALRDKLTTLRPRSAPTLDTHLTQLESSGLIRPQTIQPELECLFKHALTQDAAYGSLLLADRRALHRKVGEIIEVLFANRLDEFYGTLAEHFRRGEVWDKALHYLTQAAAETQVRNAYVESRIYRDTALEVLTHLPDDETHRRLRVETVLGRVQVAMLAEPERNAALLVEAEAVARSLPNECRLVAYVQNWMGATHVVRNEMMEAIGIFQQVLPLAHEFGDEELLAIPAGSLGRVFIAQGRYIEAEAMLAPALPALQRLWYDEWLYSLGFLALARVGLGKVAEGLMDANRMLDAARKYNNPTTLAAAHNISSLAFLWAKRPADLPRIIDNTRVIVEMSAKVGDLFFIRHAHAFAAWAYSLMGDHAQAVGQLELSHEVARRIGGPIFLEDMMIQIEAEVYFNAGQLTNAIAAAERCMELAQAMDSAETNACARRVHAQARHQLGFAPAAEVEMELAESLRVLTGVESWLEVARTHLTWGRLCQQWGNLPSARDHYEKAAGQFEKSELKDELHRTRKLITELDNAQ